MSTAPKSSSSPPRPDMYDPASNEVTLRSMFKIILTYSLTTGIVLAGLGLLVHPIQGRRGMVAFVVLALVALLLIVLMHPGIHGYQSVERIPRPWELPTMLTASVLLTSVQAFSVLFMDFGPALPLFLLPLICLLSPLLGLAILASLRHRYRIAVALAPAVAVNLLLPGGWWLMAERERQWTREGIIQAFDESPLPIAVLDSPDWEPSGMWIRDDDVLAAAIDYVPVDPPTAEIAGFSLTLRISPMRPEEETGWAPLYKGCPVEGGEAECEEHGDAVIAISGWGYEIGAVQARVEVTDGMIATLTTNLPSYYEGDLYRGFPDLGVAELSERIRLAEPEEAEEIAVSMTD